MDLALPTPQLLRVTEFVREVFGVPDAYICLTSAEGEGFYLYNKDNGCVYDVDVADIDLLIIGSLKAKWNTFFSFMEWYLG